MIRLLGQRCLLAIRCFSSITQYSSLIDDPEERCKSTSFLPVAGFFFGSLAMVCYLAFAFWFGTGFACFISLSVLTFFYSGGRLYGCLRVADRILISKGWTFKNRNRIRSERGSFRSVFLFFILTLKFFALLHVGQGWIPNMLVLMPTISAWSYIYLAHSLASTQAEEVGPFLHIRFVGNFQFWVGTIFTTAVATFFMGLEGLFFLMFLSLGTVVFERFVINRNKKFLGNILGVMMEVNELGLLLIAILMRDGFLARTTTGIMA
jgi:cobalamin synthase